MNKRYTVVAVYPDGQPYVGHVTASSGDEACMMHTRGEFADATVIAVFSGHRYSLSSEWGTL